MMATNTYPGFFPGAAEKRQDDDGSVNYATTDDGWTHDEESNAGERPAAPANTSPASGSSVLIDFSDSGDAGHSERNLGDNTLDNHTSDRDLLDGPEMALSPGPSLDAHNHSSLNPESPPFSPSRWVPSPKRTVREAPSTDIASEKPIIGLTTLILARPHTQMRVRASTPATMRSLPSRLVSRISRTVTRPSSGPTIISTPSTR